jgi:hypothetical protein
MNVKCFVTFHPEVDKPNFTRFAISNSNFHFYLLIKTLHPLIKILDS